VIGDILAPFQRLPLLRLDCPERILHGHLLRLRESDHVQSDTSRLQFLPITEPSSGELCIVSLSGESYAGYQLFIRANKERPRSWQSETSRFELARRANDGRVDQMQG
jgi:hypothetical protein